MFKWFKRHCDHHYHPTGKTELCAGYWKCKEEKQPQFTYEEGKCCRCGDLTWRFQGDDGNRG